MRLRGVVFFAVLGTIFSSYSFLFAQTSANPMAALPVAANTARLTPEQLIANYKLNDLQFSADGKRLAFVVSEPPKGKGRLRHIWVMDVTTRELRQFTNSAKNETSPRWSPDGKQIAFLSNRGENQQIYMIPSDGGEAQQLTTDEKIDKRDIESFAWSPDGKQIAYLAQEAKSDDEEKKDKDKEDARLVDKEDKRTHLWVLDVASKKSRLLVGGRWEFSSIQWLPPTTGEVATRLLVVATDHPEVEQETNRIFLVAVADGTMQTLAAPQGPFEQVEASPDGKCIGWIGARLDGPQPMDLYGMDGLNAKPRNLTGNAVDRNFHQFAWGQGCEWIGLAEAGFHNIFVRAPARARTIPVNYR